MQQNTFDHIAYTILGYFLLIINTSPLFLASVPSHGVGIVLLVLFLESFQKPRYALYLIRPSISKKTSRNLLVTLEISHRILPS